MKRRVLLLAAIVALIAGAAFFGGYLLGARPAASTSPAQRIGGRVIVPHPAAPALYTLRAGDTMRVYGINQTCVVGGTRHHAANKDLYCVQLGGARPGHLEVWLSRNQIAVAKATESGPKPVWSGKP